MNLREHEQRDSMKVWLSDQEVADLLDEAKNTEHRIALSLGARCGLRSHEVLDVAPKDVVDTDAGTMLRVHHGKGDQYREAPMPRDLKTTIETVADVRPEDDHVPLVATNETRTLRRWVKRAAGKMAEQTGDEQWNQVSFHDLRRTWATNLRNADVDPLMACDWGGWNDLETFLDHYQGRFSPEAQLREREKVGWL